MRKIFLFMLLCVGITGVFAQIKIEPNGKVKVGKLPAFDLDSENVVNLMVLGNGSYCSGGKLTFGDFGRQTGGNYNVILGEYAGDTDQLWLHGKYGLYITRNAAYTSDIVAYYDTQKDNKFHFNCDIHSTGQFITSDARFKSNVKELESPLSKLYKISGVSYNMNPTKTTNAQTTATINNTNEVESGTSEDSYLEEKGKAAIEFYRQFDENNRNNAPERFGFIAQDVQKIFPQLVAEDADGYLSIDYSGLIPVIVEALKEQTAIITAQTEKIAELESKLEEKDSEKRPASRQAITPLSNQEVDLNTNAFLYQNTPNPFSNQTEIRYFLPSEMKNASIWILSMQGVLLKKYPTDESGSLTIHASEFEAGMYFYSLIADGKEIDTKKMILTD